MPFPPPAGTRTGRLLRAPLRLVPADARVRVLAGPLRGARWIAGSATHGSWLGTFERDKARLFAGALRPGAVVFDVGAHVGYYTLLAARGVGREGRVVAFEPLPRNLRYLRAHLDINAVANVTLIPAAAGDRTGRARFERGRDSHLGRVDAAGSIEVPVVALDELVGEGTIPPPDVVKVDVEGGEDAVLVGAERTLRTARPVVFLATHGPAEARARTRERLGALGYRVRPIGAPGLGELLGLPD